MDIFIQEKYAPSNDYQVLKSRYDDDLNVYMDYERSIQILKENKKYDLDRNKMYNLLMSLVIFSPEMTFNDAWFNFEMKLRTVNANYRMLTTSPYDFPYSKNLYSFWTRGKWQSYQGAQGIIGNIDKYVIHNNSNLNKDTLEMFFKGIDERFQKLPPEFTYQFLSALAKHQEINDIAVSTSVPKMLDILKTMDRYIRKYNKNSHIKELKMVTLLLYTTLYVLGHVFDTSITVRLYGREIVYTNTDSEQIVEFDLDENTPLVENNKFYRVIS